MSAPKRLWGLVALVGLGCSSVVVDSEDGGGDSAVGGQGQGAGDTTGAGAGESWCGGEIQPETNKEVCEYAASFDCFNCSPGDNPVPPACEELARESRCCAMRRYKAWTCAYKLEECGPVATAFDECLIANEPPPEP